MLENSKFTKIDEEFICENCGRKVTKLTIHVEIIALIVYIQNM